MPDPVNMKRDNQPLSESEENANKVEIASYAKKFAVNISNQFNLKKDKQEAIKQFIETFLNHYVQQERIHFQNLLTNYDHFFNKTSDNTLYQAFIESKIQIITPVNINNLSKKIGDNDHDFNLKFSSAIIGMHESIKRAKRQDSKKPIKQNNMVTTLKERGYLKPSDDLSTQDIKDTLEKYKGKKNEIIVVLDEIAIYSNYFNDDEYRASLKISDSEFNKLALPQKTFTDKILFTEIINDAKRAADKTQKASTILFPTNNGAGHFVFIKVIIYPEIENKINSITLIDSMKEPDSITGLKHKENNEAIVKNIANILGGKPTQVFDYQNKQGENAACGFYAAREVVRAFHENSPESKTNIEDDKLAAAATNTGKDDSIDQFQREMIKEIARKHYRSPEDQQWISEIDIDSNLGFGIGIVHVKLTSAQEKEYEKFVFNLANFRGVKLKTKPEVPDTKQSSIPDTAPEETLLHTPKPNAPPTSTPSTQTDLGSENASAASSHITPKPAMNTTDTSARTTVTESTTPEITKNTTDTSATATATTATKPEEKKFTLEQQKQQIKKLRSFQSRLTNYETSIMQNLEKADEHDSKYIIKKSLRNQLPMITSTIDKNEINALNSSDRNLLVNHLYTITFQYREIEQQEKINILQLNSLKGHLTLDIDKLENLESRITESHQAGELDDSSLNKLHEDIASTKKKIQEAQTKIQSQITDFIEINLDEPEKIEAIESLLYDLQESKKGVTSQEQPSEIATIRFIAIMTQKSIDENNPTREYLDRLYRDDTLTQFLETPEGNKIKNQIESLEKEFVRQKIVRLTNDHNTMQHTLNTIEKLSDYVDLQSRIIKNELGLYEDRTAQAKAIEHWINVMSEALNKNDVLTALLIKDALSVHPKSLIESAWIEDSMISKTAKDIYSAALKRIPHAKNDHIKEIFYKMHPESVPVIQQPAEVKSNVREFTKKEKAMKELHDQINEISSSEQKFYGRMGELKSALEDYKDVEDIDDTLKEQAGKLADRMNYNADKLFNDTRVFFKKDFTDITLNDNIDNIERVLNFFSSTEFSNSFFNCAEGIYDLVWMKDFLVDENLKNPEKDNITYTNSTADEVAILPAQRLARYPLLLGDLLKKSEDLLKSIDNDPAAGAEIIRLKNNIEKMKEQLSRIKQMASIININIDTLQLNRNMAYSLLQHSKKLKPNQRNKTIYQANHLMQLEPTELYEAYRIVKDLPTGLKKIYLSSFFKVASERLKMIKNKLDPGDPDYDLKNLNYSIAIHLLNHIDGIDSKTQDNIMKHLKILNDGFYDNIPTDPHISLDFLNKVDLTHTDKAHKHRLHRRDLKKDIAKYQKIKSDQIKGKIQAELKGNESVSADVIINYLKQLQSEWITFQSSIKSKVDPNKHGEYRIKLISEAIDALRICKKSNIIATKIYNALINQLEALPKTTNTELDLDTTDAIVKIKSLHTSYTKPIEAVSFHKIKQNAFRDLYNEYLNKIKADKKDIIGKLDPALFNVMDLKDLNPTIADYLELIQADWRIQEILDNISADNKYIKNKHFLVSTAIEKLKDPNNTENRNDILETLHTALAKEKSKTEEAVRDIKQLQKIALRIEIGKEAEALQLKSKDREQKLIHSEKDIKIKHIISYLNLLKAEWIAFDTFLGQEDSHIKSRIQSITDAIIALSFFKKVDTNVAEEIYQHLVNELNKSLLDDTNKESRERAIEVLRTLVKLTTKEPNIQPDTFDGIYERHYLEIKKNKSLIIDSFTNNQINENELINSIKEFLKLTKLELDFQDVMSHLPDADQRNKARDEHIKNAITHIKDNCEPAEMNAFLNELRNQLSEYAVPNHITDDIQKIQTNYLFIIEINKIKALEIETTNKEQQISEALNPIIAMKTYLDALLNEWKAIASAIQINVDADPAHHNDQRIKLVTEALTTIKAFGIATSNEHISMLYEALIIKLGDLDTHTHAAIANRTTNAIKFLKEHVTSNFRITISTTDSFATVSMNKIMLTRIDLESELKRLDSTSIQLDIFKRIIIDYLISIKNEFTTQELDIDPLVKLGTHCNNRNQRIDDAISDLNKDIDITELKKIINTLHTELKKDFTPASKLAYTFRATDQDKKQKALLVQTKNIVQLFENFYNSEKAQELLQTLEAKKIEEDRKSQEDKFQRKTESEKLVMQGDSKNPHNPPGFARIAESLRNAVLNKHPFFTTRHSLENIDEIKMIDATHQTSLDKKMWTFERSGNIADLQKNEISPPIVAANAPTYTGLENGKFNDFKHNETKTIIREERKNNYIQISMPTKQVGYDTFDDNKKDQTDIQNAEAIVQLWVDRCGNSSDNPFLISNSAGQRLMKALIVVCQQNNIAFRVPISSLDLVTNPEALNHERLAYDRYKSSPQIKRINIDSSTIVKIEADIKLLEDRCKAEEKSKTGDELKEYSNFYQDKIAKLRGLIDSVKDEKGKGLTVKALYDAVKESKDSIEAAAHSSASSSPSMRRGSFT